jgi:hypothetical protein
MVAELKNY